MLRKRTGIWLDHSKAKLINLYLGAVQITTVHSPYTRHIRIKGKGNDTSTYQDLFGSNRENAKHNIKQNELAVYYKDLEKRLANADEILLFGPTHAKDELHNHILKNKKFAGKPITVKKASYMTEREMMAFVRKFFKAKAEEPQHLLKVEVPEKMKRE